MGWVCVLGPKGGGLGRKSILECQLSLAEGAASAPQRGLAQDGILVPGPQGTEGKREDIKLEVFRGLRPKSLPV